MIQQLLNKFLIKKHSLNINKLKTSYEEPILDLFIGCSVRIDERNKQSLFWYKDDIIIIEQYIMFKTLYINSEKISNFIGLYNDLNWVDNKNTGIKSLLNKVLLENFNIVNYSIYSYDLIQIMN